MINAVDVRVGNKVMWGVHVCTIEGIHTRNVTQKENKIEHFYISDAVAFSEYYCVEPYDLHGVPLTEQWLIDLGFKKDNYGVYELVKDGMEYVSGCEIELWVKHCVVGTEWFWDISIGKDFGSTENFAYINYVHQLQNIAFLKTGTELIYNPQPK